jgi:hypothetical protein
MNLRDIAANAVRAVLHSPFVVRYRFPDLDDELKLIIKRVMPYTMTTPERIAALCEAVRFVEANEIPGAFVECGVYQGGSSMAAALSFSIPRDLFLFDTYEGMTPPTVVDRSIRGNRDAARMLASTSKSAKIWCYSGLDDVRANMAKTGYPESRIHYVRGRVEDTVPDKAPDQIAVLRLDTDWYESTKHELEHLFGKLSPGGILIVDDYGCWRGARKAVDEFFAGTGVFLHRIDADARLIIKPLAP